MIGKVHSFQSLGTVDGPGVRAVVFMQGCSLRCACCHNPDTWEFSGGSAMEASEVFAKIARLRSYFGKDGGVTVSGGEPLMQAEFVYELFTLCRSAGIHCALDTSGCIYNEQVDKLLDVCDLVILDYKYTNAEKYKKYVGCEKDKVDAFLNKLQEKQKPTWIRQVIIPGLNDDIESAKQLFAVEEQYPCVVRTELLPFRKLCIEKYNYLGVKFPLSDTPEADKTLIDSLYSVKNKIL